MGEGGILHRRITVQAVLAVGWAHTVVMNLVKAAYRTMATASFSTDWLGWAHTETMQQVQNKDDEEQGREEGLNANRATRWAVHTPRRTLWHTTDC